MGFAKKSAFKTRFFLALPILLLSPPLIAHRVVEIDRRKVVGEQFREWAAKPFLGIPELGELVPDYCPVRMELETTGFIAHRLAPFALTARPFSFIWRGDWLAPLIAQVGGKAAKRDSIVLQQGLT